MPCKRTLDALVYATDYARNYVGSIHSRRVSPSAEALEELNHLGGELPQAGMDASEVVGLLHRYASPATMANTGGRFFGLVVGGCLPSAMGAAMLSAAWDQVATVDTIAPSAIFVERVAAGWLLDLLNLPKHASVGFTTGSSMANLIGLLTARNAQYKKLGIDICATGMAGAPPLRVVASEQSHITVFKALRILGIGSQQITLVPCDSQGRIRADLFPDVGPDTIICLQAGNVNTGASDPFAELIEPAQAKGAWVHVDGAFGLWAAASPTRKTLVATVEKADSWAVDAHKWLNTPYDCGLAISRHTDMLQEVMTTQASYLPSNTLAQPKDSVPEFSRRARGVEVWAAIRELGRNGIAEMIDRTCMHAQRLAEGLREMGYEILNDVVLNQVVAAIGDSDAIRIITQEVQEGGECWFGQTIWQGRAAIRLCVSSWATTENDIERALDAINKATTRYLEQQK